VFLYLYFICLLFLVGTVLGLTTSDEIALMSPLRVFVSGVGSLVIGGGSVSLRALFSADLTPCLASRSISAWAKLPRGRNMNEIVFGGTVIVLQFWTHC
jgi:hypothetical protein